MRYGRPLRSTWLRYQQAPRLRRIVEQLAQVAPHDPERKRLLNRMVEIWANPWSADAALLDRVLYWLGESSGPVLECGSGVSTLVLAAGVSGTTRRLVSLEHDTKWAERVSKALPKDTRADLDILVRPLVSHGEYDWYDVDESSIPGSIGFVFCDGPPGSTRGGRRGLEPVLQDRLAPGAVVLFDDTRRPTEHEIVERCCARLPADVIEDSPRHTAIRVSA